MKYVVKFIRKSDNLTGYLCGGISETNEFLNVDKEDAYKLSKTDALDIIKNRDKTYFNYILEEADNDKDNEKYNLSDLSNNIGLFELVKNSNGEYKSFEPCVVGSSKSYFKNIEDIASFFGCVVSDIIDDVPVVEF